MLSHLEGKRRQYELVELARSMGCERVEVIDDDLGRSGDGYTERPGFQRLVALVCDGSVGAVFCLEASRLARNGRDWHNLLHLCGLADVVIVDPDGVYDPNVGNDRLLLGLKGTMSEFEITLLRQRSKEARRQKAARGELRFGLPVGLEWGTGVRIVKAADEREREVRKTDGHRKPIDEWDVVLRDHFEGYISWEQYERNLATLASNAHRLSDGRKKDGRGGNALLSGLLRCACCGRRPQVWYRRNGHRYQ